MKKKKNETTDFKGFEGSPSLQSELIDSTPRAAAIVGAAALEIQIGRLLESFLIENKTETDKLIDSENINAPLGTFSAKIRACFCLGLISKDEFDDLLKIKDIRNVFAHHIADCTFDQNYIKAICDQFKIINKMKGLSEIPTRQKFTILIYTLDNIIRFRTTNISSQRRIIQHEMKFG